MTRQLVGYKKSPVTLIKGVSDERSGRVSLGCHLLGNFSHHGNKYLIVSLRGYLDSVN